jgi:transcriptional regulator with GAF, ATPase, and Fis domain
VIGSSLQPLPLRQTSPVSIVCADGATTKARSRMAIFRQVIFRLLWADCTEDPSYKQADDDFVALVDLCGVRTLLDAPLLKKGELIGTIALYRQEVRRFTDQQVELVRNFAAQAVIAIENARLLKELRQRTEEVEKLNQHLEQRVEAKGVCKNWFRASLPAVLASSQEAN